jgi:hypothetical protein
MCTCCYYCTQSFYRYNSFKNPIAASDIVQAATALTEIYGIAAYSTSLGANPSDDTPGAVGANAQKTATGADASADGANSVTVLASTAAKITSTEAFYEAYYCLGMRSDELMQKGIQAALDLQRVSVYP